MARRIWYNVGNKTVGHSDCDIEWTEKTTSTKRIQWKSMVSKLFIESNKGKKWKSFFFSAIKLEELETIK